MQSAVDGLVFVDLNYNGGSIESLNIASITRLKQMNNEWCKANQYKHPTLKISLLGVNEDITVGNLSLNEFKERINKAIKDHYDRILEKELLG